ncbi:protein SERAC1 [Trichonephila inaurata madagascariensis]|uniref:Protein SERAC1 n=1 Tax=Trichonephila inaurata madagascariensis TaxID=2747483 RepID=A0A8X7BXN2_9ARAC|nr:protein SERAC1 [Trichonephila inaurata madagascariensis]
MLWKKKIIWSSGVIGSSYIIWSYKSAIPHLESTYNVQRSHEKENASYILLPKNFGGNFYVDVGSSWFPYIPNSYNRYWNLLMLAKSEKQSVRHRAVKSLSQLSNLDSWQYMMIAQTSDLRTAVGLARSSNVSASFFLSPPFKKLEKENSREELLQLLLSLSVLDADKCIQLLAKRVEAVAYQLFKMKEGWNSELEDSYEIYHSERKKKASFIFDKLCLQVLLGYSSMKSHRSLMFEKGVLKVLYSVSKLYEDNREFQSMIAQILANLALEDMYAKDFHITGWIGILAQWAKSPCIEVNFPASRALANLDKDDFHYSIYDNGIYLLHPHIRLSKKELCADIIFVHGLLGATFWTWRQHDSMKKYNNLHDKEAINLDYSKLDLFRENYCSSPFYTFCWPKDWLAVDFPESRFISVDYNTCISKWRANCPEEEERDGLDAKANYLLHKLISSNVGKRPIVWVTHSMGGLLVKQILVEAAASKERKVNAIAQNTTGVVFFSVPHKGSDLVKLFQSIPYILQPSIDMKHLQKGSEKLLSLHENFKNFVHQNHIHVLSFGELKKSKWGLTYSMLVTEDSSDPGLGEFYALPLDHLSTCKPESRESKVYEKTVEFLTKCIPQSSDFLQYSNLEIEISNILCLI